VDDYKRLADGLHSIGEQAKLHGVKFGVPQSWLRTDAMQGQVPLN